MANKPDFNLQNALLNVISNRGFQPFNVKELLTNDIIRDDKIIFNLKYLQEGKFIKLKCDKKFGQIHVSITKKGVDFLNKNETFIAIQDDIKEIITKKIKASDAEQSVKDKLAEALNNLAIDKMKNLSLLIVRQGIDNLPNNPIQWFYDHLVAEDKKSSSK